MRSREEEYIEAIYEEVSVKGYARVGDIARRLGVAPSSVCEMLERLDRKGLVEYRKYSGVVLTDKGRELAEELNRKHRVLRDFLIILGVDEKIADEDACKIEHVVQAETIDRLTKFVEFIRVVGNPRWLDKFRVFYETGEFIPCDRQ